MLTARLFRVALRAWWLVAVLAGCQPERMIPMSIPNPQLSKEFLFGGNYVTGGGGGENTDCTFAWSTRANEGPFHGVLQDYATANRPIFLNTFALGQSLAGYDEIFVNVFNAKVAGGAAPGVVVQFGWRHLFVTLGGEGLTMAYESCLEYGVPAAMPNAVTAGATNYLGVAAAARRYSPEICEFGPIEPFAGRSFPLKVKGSILVVGVASVGAPAADQYVLVTVVPRAIGAPRSGG